MTTLTHHTGNLFDSTADGIAHGVNCSGVMGAGIAVAFRKMWPAMYEAYRLACHRGELTPSQIFIWEDTKTIYNLASQNRPGADASLEWLEYALSTALRHADQYGVRTIAMPRVGCGIGGLNWSDVEPLIAELAADHRCNIEVWTLPGQ